MRFMRHMLVLALCACGGASEDEGDDDFLKAEEAWVALCEVKTRCMWEASLPSRDLNAKLDQCSPAEGQELEWSEEEGCARQFGDTLRCELENGYCDDSVWNQASDVCIELLRTWSDCMD